ncbi:hypothetical protein [Streptomyces sp. NPDC050560]|uniref:hypothetical protein n=1 Tax=Streptomyces sp. NPDC050560 TaxID=3365630 RepID=UPI0037A81148
MATTDTPAAPARTRWARRLARGVARLIAAAGLALDAQVHARLAPQYDTVNESISQGTLFRIEAALAALAALLILVWHHRISALFAWLVAAGGLALLLIYYWVDVGTLGPFPNMYEPVWYDDKTLTVIGEGAAVLAATYLLVARRPNGGRRHRRHRRLR